MKLLDIVRSFLKAKTPPAPHRGGRRRWTTVLGTIVWLQVCLLLGLHAPSAWLPHASAQPWMTPMVKHIVELRQAVSHSGREMPLGSVPPELALRTTTRRSVTLSRFRRKKSVVVFVEDGAG